MSEKIFFNEADVVNQKIACSYFDYVSMPEVPIHIFEFESRVSKNLVYERCSMRIDRFIRDCKNEFDSDDEANPIMVFLRDAGFPDCKQMLEYEFDLLINLVIEYMPVELVSELMPCSKKPTIYFVNKINKFWFDGGLFVVSGLVYQTRHG